MNHLDKNARLVYLIEAIRYGWLTTPSSIANHFCCSEKTARNMVNDLRRLGHKVCYCRTDKKYFIRNGRR